MIVAGIVSHHLFDHKPDNLLSKGSKYNLRGFYRYGTPGIAVVSGESHDMENYVDSLKDAMPQKKFEIRYQQDNTAAFSDWKQVELGELREELAKLGLEDCFFAVSGLDPAKATGGQPEKKGKGKKKKK